MGVGCCATFPDWKLRHRQGGQGSLCPPHSLWLCLYLPGLSPCTAPTKGAQTCQQRSQQTAPRPSMGRARPSPPATPSKTPEASVSSPSFSRGQKTCPPSKAWPPSSCWRDVGRTSQKIRAPRWCRIDHAPGHQALSPLGPPAQLPTPPWGLWASGTPNPQTPTERLRGRECRLWPLSPGPDPHQPHDINKLP